MLARARQILVSELTFALNVDEEAAEARLDEVLKGEDKPAPAKKPGQEGRRRQEVAARMRGVGACLGRSSSPPGRGERFGGPKQFARARRRARRRPRGRHRRRLRATRWSSWCPTPIDWDGRRRSTRSSPAARRAPSRCGPGWPRCPDDAEVVVVHDAARPLATAALFDAVIAAVRDGADAAVPGLRSPTR